MNPACAAQSQDATAEPAIAEFNERVKQYIKLREKVEAQLPKLSTKSQPPEIEAHLVALQTNIIAARAGAKPGGIFTSETTNYIRSVIKQAFKGEQLRKLRETVREAETKGVPMRVNVPKYGVDVVFTGHEHFYERFKPQHGIYHFITGAGGKLAPDSAKPTSLAEKKFDQDQHFMLVEIAGDQMHFQVISRDGKTIDTGTLSRRSRPRPEPAA